MKTLKDIFVSKEIAKKLKEIGFNEPCIAFFEKDHTNPILNDYRYSAIKNNELITYTSAPFKNETSEGGWVYRFKISKSAKNIEKLKNVA